MSIEQLEAEGARLSAAKDAALDRAHVALTIDDRAQGLLDADEARHAKRRLMAVYDAKRRDADRIVAIASQIIGAESVDSREGFGKF